MNLRQLRTLVAIGDHGSFAAAGKVIGLSPSALSLQVKSLEEELGEELFDRALRPPVPTRSGRRLIERARQILQQIDELSGAPADERITGRLTVGAVPTTLSGIVPRALGELRDRHPDLAITVVNGSSSVLADQTFKRELDVAVITQPPQKLAGAGVAPGGRRALSGDCAGKLRRRHRPRTAHPQSLHLVQPANLGGPANRAAPEPEEHAG